nr:endo-1,4-beta-xylanase [Chloroflexota bacterium]
MRIVRAVIAVIIAQVLLWQGLGQVLPTIGREAPVHAAGTSFDQPVTEPSSLEDREAAVNQSGGPVNTVATQETTHQVRLYGYVRDINGVPLAGGYVDISDERYATLNNGYTDEGGYYELVVPQHESYHIWVGVNSETDKYMFGYIPQSKEVASGQALEIRTDFNLRPGGNIIIHGYDEQGNLLRNRAFREVTSSKAFATDLNNIPQYSYFGAVHDGRSRWDWNLAIPSFIVLPQMTYEIHIQWEVPEFGRVMLTADNEGRGYSVSKRGDKLILNLNHEIAKSKLAMLRKDGDPAVAEDIEVSAEHLEAAEGYLSQDPADMRNAVRELNLSLKHSLWTLERLQLARAEADIGKYRKGDVQIEVVDASGKAIGNSTIDFAQTSHDFLFGANPMGRNGSYDAEVAGLMEDAGVNYSYITVRRGLIEPEPGIFDWENIDSYQKIEELSKHGFELMGALSLWFCPNSDFSPPYLESMTFEELKENVYNHTYTLASRYSGRIDTWEINEMNLAGANVFNLTGEQKLDISRVFARAVKEANPRARILNGLLALPYEFMDSTPFPELLEGDIPVDIVGLVFYYSGTNTEGYPAPGLDLISVSDTLDQYSSFGKPIYIKELSAPSTQVAGSSWWHEPWDEQTQAEYVEKFYTVAFSKPLVQAITWSWGICDADAFIVSGGLLDDNLKPKPAYFALKSLIDSWITTGTGVADSEGEYNFRGFAGDYDVTVTTPDGHSLKTTIHVT